MQQPNIYKWDICWVLMTWRPKTSQLDVFQALGSGKSVRVRSEGSGVNDTFVEDESVAFRACDDPKMFGGGVSVEEVGVHHVNVAALIQGLCDFINQVLSHDVIVQLLRAPYIQGESSLCSRLYLAESCSRNF